MLADFWQALLNPAVLPIVCGAAIAITAIVSAAARARTRDELKRTLAERGMSADEIERVVKAGGK